MKYFMRSALLSFVAGLLIGALLMRLTFPFRPFRDFTSDQHHARMLKKFSSELHLSHDQTEKVGAIFKSNKAQMDALSAECAPKFDAIRSTTTDQIRSVLTPEQLTKFNSMHEKHEAHMKNMRKFMPPHF